MISNCVRADLLRSCRQFFSHCKVSTKSAKKTSVYKKPTTGFEKLTGEEKGRHKKVLSLSVAGNEISWSIINRDESKFELLDLNTARLNCTPKSNCVTVLNLAKQMVDTIPYCDLYIIEEPSTAVPKPEMVSFVMHTIQTRSYVLGLLVSRSSDDCHIITAKPAGVASTFGIQIGNENVSCQHIVKEIFENHAMTQSCQVGEEIRSKFKKADSKTREILSHVFLLNMAYWKVTDQFPVNVE